MKKRARRVKRKAPKREERLRLMVREAAKQGASEAIDHCQNFWNASDGYRRYINANIDAEADALMAAVRKAMRGEIERAVEQVLARVDAARTKSAPGARRRQKRSKK